MAVVKEKDVFDVLGDAQKLLARPGGWAKGEAVKPKFRGGKIVGYAFCATAALDVALGTRSETGMGQWDSLEPEEKSRLMNLRTRAIGVLGNCIPEKAQRRIDSYGAGLVESYNDSTTKKAVLAMYQCAVEQAKKDRAAARREARKAAKGE